MNRVRAIQKGLDKGISMGRLERIHGGTSAKTLKDDLKLLNLSPALHNAVDKGILFKVVAKKLATDFTDQNEQVHVHKNILTGKKTSSTMITAIEQYLLKKNQLDLYSNAQKNAGENGGLKQAKKAFKRIQSATASFAKKNLGDLNVINANKRRLSEVEETAKLLKKISDRLMSDIQAFKARNEINQPAEAAVVNA